MIKSDNESAENEIMCRTPLKTGNFIRISFTDHMVFI